MELCNNYISLFDDEFLALEQLKNNKLTNKNVLSIIEKNIYSFESILDILSLTTKYEELHKLKEVVADVLLELSKLMYDEKCDYYKCFSFTRKAMEYGINWPEFKLELVRIFQSKLIPHLFMLFVNYDRNLIDNMPSLNNNEVLVSMTTCKRYDLFSQTVNSFINCCLDRYLIDEWIVVDDNSSEEDRKKMKENYPFIKYIFKDETNKGHPESMNIIRDYAISRYKYLFHMEDDWRFFVKDNFITKCIKVLSENEKYGQCLLNKNYSEENEGHEISGGILVKSNPRYYIHQHLDNQETHKEMGFKKNCTYWPHYSLRVGMTRIDSLIKIGEYRKIDHFEMEYATRYNNCGYITTFLDGTFCQHSGRKTWERFDKIK